MINDNLFKGYHVGIKGNDIQVAQDIEPHLAWAKQLREGNKHNRYAKKLDTGFKPYCNVPDAISLDIMDKHHINIHDVNIQPEDMRKFKKIIKQEYPHLMYY